MAQEIGRNFPPTFYRPPGVYDRQTGLCSILGRLHREGTTLVGWLILPAFLAYTFGPLIVGGLLMRAGLLRPPAGSED